MPGDHPARRPRHVPPRHHRHPPFSARRSGRRLPGARPRRDRRSGHRRYLEKADVSKLSLANDSAPRRAAELTSAANGLPRRRPSTAGQQSGDRRESAGVPLSSAADVDAAVRGGSEALPAWRRTPAGERIQPLFKLKALLDAQLGDWRASSRRNAARPSPKRDGELRRGIENVEVATGIPTLMHGQQPRGHRLGHRRADDPPAGRRRRRHHAVQLPGDDPAVVPALRGRLRQRAHHQAVREDADDDGADVRADRAGSASRPASSTSCTAARTVVDALLDHPDVRAISLRRLDAGRPLRLRPRRRQRQARAVPGRRQEPDRHPARCRHGDDDADRRRLGVRLRRPALPGVVGGRSPWARPARRVHRADHRRGREPRRSATASTPASRWGR